MHTATTATGSPLPPPGKSLPKNRPAPLSCRATHQLAAPKPHVTSQPQCYIPAVTCHSFTQSAFCDGSLIYPERASRRGTRRHCKFNRQPCRLESAISRTKQTPAPPINRQQIATPRITNLPRRQAGHYSPITTHSRSNRQWQILEITVNLSKQTIAPRSNRHKNAFFKCQKSHVTTASHDSTVERQPRTQQAALGGGNLLIGVHGNGFTRRVGGSQAVWSGAGNWRLFEPATGCPKTTQSPAPVCCAHESDIMISQSAPGLLTGNLWRITEWFN